MVKVTISPSTTVKRKKSKGAVQSTDKMKKPKSEPTKPGPTKAKAALASAIKKNLTVQELTDLYPIFRDEVLMKKVLGVTMTNNQKGRIRQVLKDSLKGTSDKLLPQIINHKIETIIKSSDELKDSDLRKIRILYNMLKVTSQRQDILEEKVKKVKIKGKEEKDRVGDHLEVEKIKKDKKIVQENTKDVTVQKQKGPKRYVVFVGNLAKDIDQVQLQQHFADLGKGVKNIRIPKSPDDKPASFAYIELKDEQSYQMALSKNHSMLGCRRINVQYTTQTKSKITKPEAKAKAAKLNALQRAGSLVGSVPINRKRSFRRKKMKEALARQQANNT